MLSPVRYSALRNAALKLVGVRRTSAEAASRSELIQAEEEEPNATLYCLDGQLERAAEHSTLADELGWARRKRVVHAPVIRYVLRDCLVHAHGVEFFGGSVRTSGQGFRQRIPQGPIVDVPRATYCMSQVSRQFFGHWLQDACATALLANPDEALLLDIRPDWPHTAEYAEVFSLQAHASENLFVRELSLFQDFSQGSSKRQRYAELRSRAARHFHLDPSPHRPVYLRRGATGAARPIVNDDEVVRRLEDEGFLALTVDGMSVAALYKVLSCAPLVVSMDGSQQNHLYFSMPPGSSLLSFIPGDRFTATNFGYATAAGIHFGMLVVDKVEGGYVVDVANMMRTLDLFPR
ncbi:glycosyltransferase 61 family protein [Hydrogenophaga sp.]|uniref:glycosyltransferase 61 family protein n=1 Tax=Hydrogenophaga sp. TaxID=1904254 RepID=UPI002719423D|nr:glycosyltransferase family 61 protein [Hydrogenophaga sp.]MDO8904327.1 glycosyltransferase family 61 protein [Hydrogenophaga sp.]